MWNRAGERQQQGWGGYLGSWEGARFVALVRTESCPPSRARSADALGCVPVIKQPQVQVDLSLGAQG